MSEARVAQMGKIKASIDGFEFDLNQEDLNRLADEEIQLDQAAAVQSNKDLIEAQRLEQAKIKTEADILRLEEAKRKATSQAVKEQLAEEIRLAKEEKAKREEEEKQAEENPDLASGIKGAAGGAVDQAGKTVDRVLGVAREAWDGLARVTTPGTIFLPVAVLLVFFFLLLPINGYTRAGWLWLALTGNANISGYIPNGASGDFGSTGGTPGGASGDFGTNSSTNTSASIFLAPLQQFTGVEGP